MTLKTNHKTTTIALDVVFHLSIEFGNPRSLRKYSHIIIIITTQ